MHLSKKFIGILAISVSFILIVCTNIYTYTLYQDKCTELLDYDNSLMDSIEILTQENIKLQQELLSANTDNTSDAVLLVEYFLEQLWENSNTQYSEIISRLTTICTDDVINLLSYNEVNGNYEILETYYGDTIYETRLFSTNTYYDVISTNTVNVLCLADIYISVNGSSSMISYIYEIEVEYINDDWCITNILQKDAYSIAGE